MIQGESREGKTDGSEKAAGAGVRTAVLPRIMLAAEKSGEGKTLLTCALLSILKDMGFAVRGFKCGPDYIDPMFHRRVLGVPSYNLDSFFSDGNGLRYLLGRHGEPAEERAEAGTHKEPAEGRKAAGTAARMAETGGKREGEAGRFAVIEGVMGYYDGLGGATERGSAYEVARETDTPVILLVDMKGRSLSALASLKGYLGYRADSRVCGVIFNRLPPALYPGLKEAAEREFGPAGQDGRQAAGGAGNGGCGRQAAEDAENDGCGRQNAEDTGNRGCGRRGLRVLGYVPEITDFSLESRHLGLVRPEEIPEFQKKIEALAERIRPGLELDELLALAGEAAPLSWRPQAVPAVRCADGLRPRIAVAKDEAFCFYYADNLETLEQMGAELAYFSPLRDRELPEGTDGLYLGGGYPELYAQKLSENAAMRECIRRSLAAGLPCIAECGGYLYLKETLCDPEGNAWPMAGVLPGGSRNYGRLRRFGYGTMTIKTDGILGDAGQRLAVHEFHHWDSEDNGTAFRFEKPVGARAWDCGYHSETLYAGFPHLYFYGHAPYRFLKRAADWAEQSARETRRTEREQETRKGEAQGRETETRQREERGRETETSRGEAQGREQELRRLLETVRPSDRAAMAAAAERWNSVAKPIGSLGILETDMIRIAGMTGDPLHAGAKKPALVVMCADHGVVAEGVSQTGQAVTRIVAENFTRGKTCTSLLCRRSHTAVFPVDIGMRGRTPVEDKLQPETMLNRKVAEGSGNIAIESAMSGEQCIRAVFSGLELVRDLQALGYDILATGEMGIGNTTPAAAMAAMLLRLPPERAAQLAGRGAGLSDEGLLRKQKAVTAAAERFCRLRAPEQAENSENGNYGLRVLAELGGFDIAGLVGLFLGAAVYRIPILIDGFISSVAALCAAEICPAAKEFMIASHVSSEPAAQAVMERLGLPAPLHCGLHLGEGSGAVAFLPLLQMGGEVYEQMSTFEEIRVDRYVDYAAEDRRKKCGR